MNTTVREAIREALRGAAPLTARDLSQRVHVREHDISDHLEHLERTLKHTGVTLVVEPPTCMSCGFAFPGRHRFTRPGGCPQCKGRRITPPRFSLRTSNAE